MEDSFARILAPIEPSAFTVDSWERRPLYIPGSPAKVEPWSVDATGFFTGLLTGDVLADQVRVTFADRQGRHREQAIGARLAPAMFAAGMTVTVDRLERGNRALERLVANTRRLLGHAGDVSISAYASPAGGGVELQCQPQSVFVIQLDGSNHWQYAPSQAMPAPPRPCLAEESADFARKYPWARLSAPDALVEQTLQPGDVLYLPSGTWYRARAHEDAITLKLTVQLFSVRDLLLGLLEEELGRDPRWRQYLPLGATSPEPTSGLPPSFVELVTASIADLQARIANLSVAQLGIAWRTRLVEKTAGREPTFHVTREHRLRVNQPACLLKNPQDETIAFFAGPAALEMPAETAPFLERLVQHTEFVARDAVDFCPPDEELEWSSVHTALQMLVEAGALSNAGANPILTRAIPRSGERLPAVGLGTFQAFDVDATNEARRPILEILARFLEVGARVIDSSPMYGRSEAVIGEELAKIPDARPFLATKVWAQGREIGIQQMEASMERMRTERLDLMQVHNLLDAETHLPVLHAWKAAGKIRYVGATHHQHDQFDAIEKLMKEGLLDFIQIPYSVVDRRAEARILSVAADTGTAVLVMQPFGSGTLIERVKKQPLPRLASELDCTTWAQFFLKFIISHPAVTCVLPATSDPVHVVDNLQAGFGCIPDARQRARMSAVL